MQRKPKYIRIVNLNKNKISVNLLCVCIIALISITVLFGLGVFTQGFVEGMSETREPIAHDDYLFLTASFTPASMAETPDSIMAADGHRLPIFTGKGSVGVPIERIQDFPLILLAACGLLTLVIFIFLLVQFVKLIVNFNRGRIFEVRNCRYLSRIGVSMLVMAVLSMFVSYGNSQMIIDAAGGLKNYSTVNWWALLPSSDFIVGLLALLFAQIWKRGISIKNENELTV